AIADEVLGVQATAGNVAARRLVDARLSRTGGPAVAPVAPPPGAVTRHTAAEIRAMTLAEFESFATRQADWGLDPGLAADVEALRGLLEFAREEEAGKRPILSGCGRMTVADLLATGMTDGVRTELRAFGQAVAQSHPTVRLQATADVAKARGYGAVIPKLEANPGGAALRKIINQPEALDRLIAAGAVDDFAAYCAAQRPTLEAEDQARSSPEITSYLAMRASGDAALGPSLPDVRNLHRFEHAALAALVANLALTEEEVRRQARPLVLILHSTFDHNGAFHRDPNLTAVITQADKLVLLVEGKESLAEMGDRIGPLAARYGHDGKVHQAMLAGHGNAQTIQMAGTLGPGGEEQHERVRTGHDPASDEFLRKLVDNMATGPDTRIVLNACLTASNRVTPPPGGLSADPDTAAAQVQAAIAADPSLRDYVAAAAAGKGVSVRGANASFGQVGLLDPSGNLDIVAPPGRDPMLTASKADYARSGTEPQGVMRALLEVWAMDRTATPRTTTARTIVTARIAGSPTGWDARIIWALCRAVDADFDNAELIRLLAEGAGALAEVGGDRDPSHLAWIPRSVADRVYRDMTGATAWSSQHELPLLVYQHWLQATPGRGADFTTHLAAHFTCQTAKRLVKFPFIAGAMAGLLPAGTPTPARGHLQLALMGVMDDNGVEAESRRFLREVAGTASHFDAALGIDALLDGNGSQAEVEEKVGLGAAPVPAPPGPSPPNVDLDGDGVPDVFVEPMERHTATTTSRANLRSRPSATAPILGSTKEKGRLIVTGTSGDWYMVEHRTAPRFVHTSLVTLGHEPNVDIDRDGVNDFYVEPITRRGAVTARRLNVREYPGLDERVVAGLDKDVPVVLIGTSGDWYAIEHAGRTRFVHQDWVRLEAQL
ncbi:MAG: SH3 domain-containing protein, partial [Actinomycetota bacterium]